MNIKNSPLRLHAFAPFDRSAKVRWLLREMNIQHEDRWLDNEKNENESPAFLKLNPMGRVPVIEVGDQVMFESGAICAYLSDLHLDKGMAPTLDSPERVDYQKWMYFASTTLDSIQMRIMIIEDMPAGEVQKQKEKAVQDELRDSMEALDRILSKNSFLVGNRFSAADICVSYHLYWLPFWPELKSVTDAFPKVNEYVARMLARPAAQTAEWPKPSKLF